MDNDTNGVIALILALHNDKKLSAKEILDLVLAKGFPVHGDESNFGAYFELIRKMSVYPGNQSWDLALRDLEKNAEFEIKTLPIVHNLYPKSLKHINNPPPLLHVRGNLDLFEELPGIAVVGTRNVTKNGKEISFRLGKYFSSKGWIVVSGLAKGVDASAHSGAISNGSGNTIAVLAHGLQEAQPKETRNLAYTILESGGAWVSEHRVGVPAKREHFVPRNRIQLGLSSGSIIVEAEERSGSITQAKFCVKEKRPLFAVVPLDSNNRLGLRSSGTEYLVRELGAMPVKSKEDYQIILDKITIQKEYLKSL